MSMAKFVCKNSNSKWELEFFIVKVQYYSPYLQLKGLNADVAKVLRFLGLSITLVIVPGIQKQVY